MSETSAAIKLMEMAERAFAQRDALAQALEFIEKKSDIPDNGADVLSWAAMLHSRIRDIHALAKGSRASVGSLQQPVDK